MIRLIMIAAMMLIFPVFAYAETIIEFNESSDGPENNLTVHVPMSVWEQRAELTFDVLNPTRGKGIVSFYFKDPILNMLNKTSSNKFDVTLVGVEHNVNDEVATIKIAFDASRFVEEHELAMAAAREELGEDGLLDGCVNPEIISDWEPEAQNVESGMSFSQFAKVRCGEGGAHKVILTKRYAIGVK